MKAVGEGPNRGLLHDYEHSDGPSFQALICNHLCEDASLPEAGLVLVEHHGDGVELLLGERGEEHAAPHRARQSLHRVGCCCN